MNIATLLDDLEAASCRLSFESVSLENLQPVDLENAVFAKDHFAGIVAGTSVWRLCRYAEPIQTEPGHSAITNTTITQSAKKLVGLWLQVEAGQRFSGRLLAVEHNFLIFRSACVPVSAVQTIELRAVDNPAD